MPVNEHDKYLLETVLLPYLREKINIIKLHRNSSFISKISIYFMVAALESRLDTLQRAITNCEPHIIFSLMKDLLEHLAKYIQTLPQSEVSAVCQSMINLTKTTLPRLECMTDSQLNKVEESKASVLLQEAAAIRRELTKGGQEAAAFEYRKYVPKLQRTRAILQSMREGGEVKNKQLKIDLNNKNELLESLQKKIWELYEPLEKLTSIYQHHANLACNAMRQIGTKEEAWSEPNCFDLGYKCQRACCHSGIRTVKVFEADHQERTKHAALSTNLMVSINEYKLLHSNELDTLDHSITMTTSKIERLKSEIQTSDMLISNVKNSVEDNFLTDEYSSQNYALIKELEQFGAQNINKHKSNYLLFAAVYSGIGNVTTENQPSKTIQLFKRFKFPDLYHNSFSYAWFKVHQKVEEAFTQGAAASLFSNTLPIDIGKYIGTWLTRQEGAKIAQVNHKINSAAKNARDVDDKVLKLTPFSN